MPRQEDFKLDITDLFLCVLQRIIDAPQQGYNRISRFFFRFVLEKQISTFNNYYRNFRK